MNKLKAQRKEKEKIELQLAIRKLRDDLCDAFYIPQIAKWLDGKLRKLLNKR